MNAAHVLSGVGISADQLYEGAWPNLTSSTIRWGCPISSEKVLHKQLNGPQKKNESGLPG